METLLHIYLVGVAVKTVVVHGSIQADGAFDDTEKAMWSIGLWPLVLVVHLIVGIINGLTPGR